jgi:hypothetical protein
MPTRIIQNSLLMFVMRRYTFVWVGKKMTNLRSYGRQDDTQTTLSVSIDKDMKDYLMARARARRMSASTYVRQLVLRDMDEQLPPKNRRDAGPGR